ncbi:MAG: hypothetical protein Kow00109_18400 [Acidobacteriota bacterium]
MRQWRSDEMLSFSLPDPSDFTTNPSFAVALAMAAGVVAQSVARHLRIPGIVILLATGVVLGPDGLHVLDPSALGHALDALIGFAVAVILFEGGLNLSISRMRRQAPVIRYLLSVGAAITVIGAALSVRFILGWEWVTAFLFGTLVIVTGPTVITPLLRRVRVKRSVETILESEGILIDAVGAVAAVVALELVLEGAHSFVALGALEVPLRLLVGLLVGALGGWTISALLRHREIIPEGFENIFTLASVLTLYQVSNVSMPESGIMAAVTAGVVVGNRPTRVSRDLREFKEQLTVLLIGMLFVLLAADVRLGEVAALGWGGALVVLALMFVVRPANVLVCTWRSQLGWREKAFLSWVAPRGIVAAAIASLFAERLTQGGYSHGAELRALVFLVIAGTVVFQGATAAFVARILRLQRATNRGYAILGAQPFGRLLAHLLVDHGEEAVLIDSNATHCREAEDEGLTALYGNALDETLLLHSQMDTRRAAIGATQNEAVNMLFAIHVREEASIPRVYVVLERSGGVPERHLEEAGVRVFGGTPTDVELWSVRVRRGLTAVELWERQVDDDTATGLGSEEATLLFPLFTFSDEGVLQPVDEQTRCRKGTRVFWLLLTERHQEAATWLESRGWTPVRETDESGAAADDPRFATGSSG